MFGSHPAAPFKDRAFAFTDLLEFIPEDFFPFESERDLMCRLLIALQRGRMAHLQDEIAKALASDRVGKEPAAQLPPPGTSPFGNYRRVPRFQPQK